MNDGSSSLRPFCAELETKWLCYKSLALLAMPRKSGDEAVKSESEIKIEEEHSDHILELQGPQLHVQWQARTWGSCVFGAGGRQALRGAFVFR